MESILEMITSPTGLHHICRNDLIDVFQDLAAEMNGEGCEIGKEGCNWLVKELTRIGNPPVQEESDGSFVMKFSSGAECDCRYYYSPDKGLYLAIVDVISLMEKVKKDCENCDDEMMRDDSMKVYDFMLMVLNAIDKQAKEARMN